MTVTSYQVPYSQPEAPSAPVNGQLGITSHIDTGPLQLPDASVVPVPPGGSFAIRTPTGTRVYDPAAIGMDDVIEIAPGQETSVAAAMSMGLLSRDAAGRIVPVGAAAPPSSPPPDDKGKPPLPIQQQDTPNTRLDDESEATIADAMARAPGASIGVAVSVIENAGEVPEAVIGQLAADLGIEPEQARVKLQGVQAAYAKEATTSAAKAAGTSEAMAWEAFQHYQRTGSSDFKAAMHSHLASGRPTYGSHVIEYIAQLDQIDPQRILGAETVDGRSVRWDPASGQIVVKIKGRGEMSWAHAVRQRLISVQ